MKINTLLCVYRYLFRSSSVDSSRLPDCKRHKMQLPQWADAAPPAALVASPPTSRDALWQRECALYFQDTLFEDFSKRGLALYDALRFRFEAAPFRQQLQKAGWSNNRYMCLYSISVKPISLWFSENTYRALVYSGKVLSLCSTNCMTACSL